MRDAIAALEAALEILHEHLVSCEDGGMCSICGAEPKGDKRLGTFVPQCPSWCAAEKARALLARIEGK